MEVGSQPHPIVSAPNPDRQTAASEPASGSPSVWGRWLSRLTCLIFTISFQLFHMTSPLTELELMLRYILYLWVCRFLFPRLIAPHVSVCQHTLAVYAHVICSNQFSSISSRLSAAVFMGNILKKQEKLKQLPAKKCLWIGEIWMDLPNSKMYKDTRSTINSSV